MRAALIKAFNEDLSIETVPDPDCPKMGWFLKSPLAVCAVLITTVGLVATRKSRPVQFWGMNIAARLLRRALGQLIALEIN